jgi:hypothetical protein
MLSIANPWGKERGFTPWEKLAGNFILGVGSKIDGSKHVWYAFGEYFRRGGL